jgi:3-oxoacyl-[acyl-carrier protein] reductase
MTELTGKRALVTGASRGIGAAIALALAEKGADVAITYERSAERAAEVARAIEAKGRRGFAIQADSADAEAVKRSVDEAASSLGGLDILVNNAGIARGGPVAEASLADIDALLAVNIRSVVLASQAAIAHLPDGGRIISIGSNLAERVAFGGITIYSMTKSALLSFTRGLARELGPRGITVNLVHPGSTETDMNPADGETADGQRALSALGHFGRPEDVAAAVAFLAGPGARQITGTGLNVDGGANA